MTHKPNSHFYFNLPVWVWAADLTDGIFAIVQTSLTYIISNPQ